MPFPHVAKRRFINPILRIILEGVYDSGSPLYVLKGTPHIVQNICKFVTNYWQSLIKIGEHVVTPRYMKPGTTEIFPQNKFVMKVHKVTFPKPQKLYINMMPFVMAKEFSDCCLPTNLLPYWESLIKPLFRSNIANASDEEGKICFLTIHESKVSRDQTQRRPGLHIENPGKEAFKDIQYSALKESDDMVVEEGQGNSVVSFYESQGWGMGINTRREKVEGGIYMASNVSDSCKVWNSHIQTDCNSNNQEIIGRYGDIEHLRHYLGQSLVMDPSAMYWITDRTPHESLPLRNNTYRQYFRLVTHQVSLWFEDHSTKSPLGVVPDSKITKIVKGSKFGDHSLLKVVQTTENHTDSNTLTKSIKTSTEQGEKSERESK